MPLIIAEIGINHNGDIRKALDMIATAKSCGVQCVKFQCHIPDDEMSEEAKSIKPPNDNHSIYDIIEKASFGADEEAEIKRKTESLGLLYLCTPFSKAAVNELDLLGVKAFKIGSGECNNYPFIEYVAQFRKPIILSTGMNNIETIAPAVKIIEDYGLEYGLLHCTSMYPTPYDKVRLGAMKQLKDRFPKAHVGLSDHSLGIWTALAAVALGAEIIEKHFTLNRNWPGPDNKISILPGELRDLVNGARAITQAMGGKKEILEDEKPVSDFAYASVVSTRDIKAGEELTSGNIWVKRPGGGIHASYLPTVLGCYAKVDIPANTQVHWMQVYSSNISDLSKMI